MSPSPSATASVSCDPLLDAGLSQALGAALTAEGLTLVPGDAGATHLTTLGRLGQVRADRVVALYDGQLTAEHASALRRGPPVLLLACRDEGRPSRWELRTLSSLLTGRTLRPRELGWRAATVGSMVGLEAAAREASAVVRWAGGAPSAGVLASDVTHELVANALLDAPADGEGRPKYAFRRDEAPNIAPPDACEVAFAVGEGRLFISVTDRFGRFQPAPLAAAIEGLGKKAKLQTQGGGAGLGLRRIIEHSELFAARVLLGRRTEVVCAVSLDDLRRRSVGPKSVLFHSALPE